MKQLFFLLSAVLLLWSCHSADSKTAGMATGVDALKDSANFTTVQWIDSTSQDLGKVKEGQVAEITWRFKNSGNKPLVIQNVTPGCGCTLAEKPEEPIMPGKDGVIKAKFNSQGQHEGEHVKNVTVHANTQGNTITPLQFRVNVVK